MGNFKRLYTRGPMKTMKLFISDIRITWWGKKNLLNILGNADCEKWPFVAF